MKVVLIGKGLMLANMILATMESGCEIAGVLRYERTCQTNIKTFIDDFLNNNYEAALINKFKLKDLHFKSANSEKFKKFLIKNNIDLLIIGTWKEKIKKEIFIVPKIASINIHPSLLPKYRGPNPYIQTILNGEEYSGVSLHLLDENYDSGAILSQEKIKILETDTSKELKEKTVIVARKLLKELLISLQTSILTPIQQNNNSTYFKNITGNEKMLDFEANTTIEISRIVRALHPFLPTYITYKNHFFIVNPYKFRIIDLEKEYKPNTIINKNDKTKSLTITCKDNKAIQFDGLNLYNAKAFTKLFIKYFVKLT